MPQRPPTDPTRFAYIRVIAFLLGFAVLITFVARYYLLPATEAFSKADPSQRRVLSGYSRLLLAIVLFILLVGTILTFRIGRFFFPRPRDPAPPTRYPDAYAESARRIKVEDLDE